jgi:hypothetical protein
VTPRLTDLDASPAVIFETGFVRVIAARDHPFPGSVLRPDVLADGSPVSSISRSRDRAGLGCPISRGRPLAFPASTADRMSRSKVIAVDADCVFSTCTAAHPVRTPPPPLLLLDDVVVSDDGQAAEHSAGQVNECVRHADWR